jgi:protein-tyrosine phosphatase
MENDCIPNRILPQLFLGSKEALTEESVLKQLNISAVVDLSGLDLKQLPGMSYLCITVLDHKDVDIGQHFGIVHAFMHHAIQTGQTVLVHCNQGISRSATIIISYLMKYAGFSLAGAFRYTKRQRRIILPNPGYMRQLITFERICYPEWENSSMDLSPYDAFIFQGVPSSHCEPVIYLPADNLTI